VTHAEVKALVETDIAGVTVSQNGAGATIVTTDATGVAISLEVSAHTAVNLGLTESTTTGADASGATATADIGFGAGTDADLLDDGASIVGTGESFGSGDNATPTQPHNIGGGKLRVLVESNDNVVNLSAGDLTATVLYVVI